MITMNNQRLSLITPDAHAGLNLAGELAEHLHTQLQAANDRVERPGGTNYLLPPLRRWRRVRRQKFLAMNYFMSMCI